MRRVATLAIAAMLSTAAMAQDTTPAAKGDKPGQGRVFTKPIAAPELQGPITPFDPAAPDAQQKNPPPKTAPDPGADLAFGAFQRGYYLTALELALPRAEAGDPAAQTLIAEIYTKGYGVARDPKKGAQWYAFAADAGNREAQFAYANLLLRGGVVGEDKEKAEALLRKAADAGHKRAAFNLSQIITAKRPTWAGFKEALPFYEKAAEGGVTDAQYALAIAYAEARGVPTNDEARALEWLRRAAEGGLDTAQTELGTWLANGRATTADPAAAFGWFARAARQGNVIAQNRLARMYDTGFGVERDPVQAGAWHILARRAGFSDSQMDRRFAALSDIDRKRALEAAKSLGGR